MPFVGQLLENGPPRFLKDGAFHPGICVFLCSFYGYKVTTSSHGGTRQMTTADKERRVRADREEITCFASEDHNVGSVMGDRLHRQTRLHQQWHHREIQSYVRTLLDWNRPLDEWAFLALVLFCYRKAKYVYVGLGQLTLMSVLSLLTGSVQQY